MQDNSLNKGGNKITTNGTEVISLWLATYDDLFSDFDPRSFTKRVLSDDFIS
jgi:hypothetical protein